MVALDGTHADAPLLSRVRAGRVGAVILLRPTKSFALHMQQIGRGMRVSPGKDYLIVNDHVGNVITHGLPSTERTWTLRGVGAQGYKVPPHWHCHECHCVNEMSSLTCIECGADRPTDEKLPTVGDGELTELTAERLAAIRTMPYRQMVSQRRSEAELREYARAHKYHHRWVTHRLREQAQMGGAS